MITTPSWLSIPTAGSTASISTTGLNMSNLYTPGNLLPAEHLNYFLNGTTNNGNVSEQAVKDILTELQNNVTATGLALDPTDFYQSVKADIIRKNTVGQLLWFETPQTPVIYSAAQSTTNPSNPQYNPVIARWDADHDVTSTQAPDLVTAYRAVLASINVLGTPTASWTSAVGSTSTVISFASNNANLALLNLLVNEATANGYIATQTVGAAAVYSGTAQRCIRVAGTDYPITGASVGGLSITCGGGGLPTGSQTITLPTYCISGSTTSVRLPRLSGMVGIVAYDYDGVYVPGWRKLDIMQGHYHTTLSGSFLQAVGSGGSNTSAAGTTVSIGATTGAAVTDGANGTPRTGKNTNPWAYGLLPYTWAGRLLA